MDESIDYAREERGVPHDLMVVMFGALQYRRVCEDTKLTVPIRAASESAVDWAMEGIADTRQGQRCSRTASCARQDSRSVSTCLLMAVLDVVFQAGL